AKLVQQRKFVQATPALHDAAVAKAPDVDARHADGAPRWRHAEDLALMSAAGRELLDHQVALGDEDARIAVPVREPGPEHGGSLPHPLPASRRTGRRIMVDEVLGEVLIDGAEITSGEHGVDERGHGLLVLLGSVHARSLRPPAGLGYPNNLGFPSTRPVPGCH